VVTCLAAALSAGVGAPGRTLVLVTAAVLTGQLSIGWSNDWIDAGRDLVVGRSDKPVVVGLVTPAGLRRAALVAAALCVVLSLSVGLRPGIVHLAAVACGWAYNDSLKWGVWSWLPYAVAFGLLPMFVVLALPGGPQAAGWAVGAAALLGVGAHLANVLPDLEDDAEHGIRGLPHRLGRTATSLVAPAVLAAAVAVVVVAPRGAPGQGGWWGGSLAVTVAGAAGVVAVRRPHSRLPFALTMAVAGVCVVLLVLSGRQLVIGR
jgi:4-hydroxybenzoate polyprenyltransferase